MDATQILPAFLAFALAPLLQGVINRTKAVFAGRRGPPLLQPYFDLAKLARKGAVYGSASTAVVRIGPPLGLACAATAVLLLPAGGVPAPLSFAGDLILFVYLLALARFATVMSALDTGSSFEAMGASREVTFSALAEPALLLGLVVALRGAGDLSLGAALGASSVADLAAAGASLFLVAFAIFVVFLAENARIPFDDPNTHLELTMIHEVMVLDHGGVDLAYISYGASLKMWALGGLLVGLIVPAAGFGPWLGLAAFLVGIFALGVITGAVESTMARAKLVRVPRLLVGATGLCALAMLLVLV